MRIYNPALGRFLSVDPLQRDYPELTTYQFASNTPIQAVDLDGLEMVHCTLIMTDGKPALKVNRVDIADISGSKWEGWQYTATIGDDTENHYSFNSAEDLVNWAANGGTGVAPNEASNADDLKMIGLMVLMAQQDAFKTFHLIKMS